MKNKIIQNTWIMSLLVGGLATVGCNGNDATNSDSSSATTAGTSTSTAIGTTTNTGTIPTPTAIGGGNTPAPVATPVDLGPPTKLGSSLAIRNKVDLRSFDGPIENQFGGTCTDFGTAAAMDNVLHQEGYADTISVEDLWADYGVYDVDAAVKAASTDWVHDESYWPVNGVKSNITTGLKTYQISQYQDLNADVNATLQAVNKNHPVIMAFQVTQSMANCDTNISATSPSTGGGHVMEIAGYQLDDSVAGGGYFIMKNSWGPDCGDHGYLYYPFALCSRSDLYCYFIEVDAVAEKTI